MSDTVKSSTDALDNLASSQQALSSLSNAVAMIQQAFAGLPFINSGTMPASRPMSLPLHRLAQVTDGGATADPGQAIADWLKEYVFTDDNLESSDGNTAVFRLRGVDFCTKRECTRTCGATGCTESCGETSVDDACADAFDRIEVRVRATMVGEDGADIELLIGPDKVAPILFELRPQSIALELDIAGAKTAIEHINGVLGGNAVLPRVMQGRVRVEIKAASETDIQLSASVLEMVAIEADTSDGVVALRIAKADPLFVLHAKDGNVSMALSAGSIDLSAPMTDMRIALTGPAPVLDVHLDGASFALDVKPADTQLQIKGIGLGNAAATIKVNQTEIFALNLNADSGRKLDLTVTPDQTTGSALFAVAPELDLTLKFYLKAIASDTNPVESYLMDETYRVTLEGANGASVMPVPPNPYAYSQGGLKVVSGALTISSTAASAPVVVSVGQCLLGNGYLPTDAHPILGYFTAGECN